MIDFPIKTSVNGLWWLIFPFKPSINGLWWLIFPLKPLELPQFTNAQCVITNAHKLRRHVVVLLLRPPILRPSRQEQLTMNNFPSTVSLPTLPPHVPHSAALLGDALTLIPPARDMTTHQVLNLLTRDPFAIDGWFSMVMSVTRGYIPIKQIWNGLWWLKPL